MTSGGYSKAEAWNLQLQGKVQQLESEIQRLRVAYKLAVGRYPEPAPEPPVSGEPLPLDGGVPKLRRHPPD